MLDRDWSQFEMQLFLALIAKGVHIHGRGKKRTSDPAALRYAARMDFVTAFNKALNGDEHNYEQDIDKAVILRKLDELMIERKHVLGKGGIVERNSIGILTRTMTRAFRRTRDMNFTGSKVEWKAGRRREVMKKLGVQLSPSPEPVRRELSPKNKMLVTYRGLKKAARPEDRDPGHADAAVDPRDYSPRHDANTFFAEDDLADFIVEDDDEF